MCVGWELTWFSTTCCCIAYCIIKRTFKLKTLVVSLSNSFHDDSILVKCDACQYVNNYHFGGVRCFCFQFVSGSRRIATQDK